MKEGSYLGLPLYISLLHPEIQLEVWWLRLHLYCRSLYCQVIYHCSISYCRLQRYQVCAVSTVGHVRKLHSLLASTIALGIKGIRYFGNWLIMDVKFDGGYMYYFVHRYVSAGCIYIFNTIKTKCTYVWNIISPPSLVFHGMNVCHHVICSKSRDLASLVYPQPTRKYIQPNRYSLCVCAICGQEVREESKSKAVYLGLIGKYPANRIPPLLDRGTAELLSQEQSDLCRYLVSCQETSHTQEALP